MPSLRQKARYRFDNWMSRGTGAQIILLALLTIALVLVATLALKVYSGVPTYQPDDQNPGSNQMVMVDESTGKDVFRATIHAMDPGTIGNDLGAPDDEWSWGFLGIMMFVTIGGIFILSALIGILNNGLGGMIESLRRGRSTVVEHDHTVILGYSPKVHTLLRELAVAGQNQKDPCVVLLADRDKVEMDEEVNATVHGTRLRVVTRRANPMNLADLHLASLASSKAVVVLAPESDGVASVAAHEADTVVLKTLLAVSKAGEGHDLHVVAEIQDEKTEAVARMVCPDAALVVSPPLISRLLVQTGRQSGLSMVYSELLDFGGAEIYIQPQPALAGVSFRDAVFRFDTSTLLGVVTVDDELLLPPPLDRKFAAGDSAIVISEDDDTVVLDGRAPTLDEAKLIAAARKSSRHEERTLILGASDRLGLVLRELDSYVAKGSTAVVVGDGEALAAAEHIVVELANMQVERQLADVTSRKVLDGLDVAAFDHVLVLSETDGRDQEMADARTMITLLHLRDILRKAGKKVPITSEILHIQNRDLAAVAEADDFIVSNTLVSLLLSQISENRHLVEVFDDLFSAGGDELYLKPAGEYVALGVELTYAAVVEAALRRDEVAIGVRFAAKARDPESSFGVVVNPKKSAPLRLAEGDKIIVLADE